MTASSESGTRESKASQEFKEGSVESAQTISSLLIR